VDSWKRRRSDLGDGLSHLAYLREGLSCLAEGGGDGFEELGFLFGKDGAQVEDEVVVRDAGDNTDGGGAAEALLKLRG
jgi:hypothetical protein